MTVKRGSTDWRLRIGHIAPTIWDYGDQYRKLLPEGMIPVVVTLGAVSYDRDNMAEVRAQRKRAARLLEQKDADCVIAGGVPVSTLDGPGAEDEFIAEIEDELAIPFTTSSRCAVDSIKALNAKRVVVTSPHPVVRDDELVTYFSSYGIETVAVGGPDLEEPHEVRSLPDSEVYRQTMATVSTLDEDFDAVYVPCAPFASVDQIDVLERDVGRPVVTSCQAQVWKALDMTHVHPTIDGFGQLYQL